MVCIPNCHSRKFLAHAMATSWPDLDVFILIQLGERREYKNNWRDRSEETNVLMLHACRLLSELARCGIMKAENSADVK